MKTMRPLLLTCGLALVLSACGGSGSDATVDDGSDTTVAQQGETTTSGANQGHADTTTTASGGLGEPIGDLPRPCEFISAEDMSTLLGVEVTSEEEYGSDCFYIPVAGFGAGFDAHTSALALSPEDCRFLLQTEPILPGETVEPATDYGDLASIITTATSTQIEVCAPEAAVMVTVSGSESDRHDERLAAARQIVDMILADL